ncbi:MAG: CRISPR-associated protein Cas4 [Chloroflexota bacterium]|jgi:CRISPR-associated exonuclease Cas4
MCPEPTQPLDLLVSDVRQWVYCPRIVYYRLCQPLRRPVTYKMEEGKLQHTRIEELELRRTLRAYGLRREEQEGKVERHYRPLIRSGRLGLSGVVDLVLVLPFESVPVEFKHTESSLGLNHKYQLVAYALLVEARWEKPVRRALVHFLPSDRVEEVAVTPNGRTHVQRMLRAIREMVSAERLPPPTPRRGRCLDCEYRLYCGDVEGRYVFPE